VPYFFSEIKRVSRGGNDSLFILFLLVAFVVFYLFIMFREKRSKTQLIGWAIFIILVMFFLSTVLVSLGGARSTTNIEFLPIQVIEKKKVGVYDLVILKSTDAGYMVNWLNKNGYKVSDESISILQEYSSKPNFYFIVNKISQETLSREDLLEELATPLQITFQPEEPFYPLKMSSINGGRTMINVYFFSDKPFRDKSGILSIKKSRYKEATRGAISLSRNQEVKDAMFSLFPMSHMIGDIYGVFAGSSVITWLHYEGDLKDLRQDAYFGFDSITCDSLISKNDDKWPYFEFYAEECHKEAESIYYKNLAISEKNPSFCEKTEFKDRCYKELALILDDFSLCEKLPTKPGHSFGKEVCYQEFIYKFKSLSECEKLLTQDSKDICIDYFAVHNRDFSLCDAIVSESKRNDCYATAAFYTKDPSICEKITAEGERKSCYQRLSD